MGLDDISRAEAGARYAIRECPMQEEPLHLIPPDLRPDVETEFGLYIEGDLCPQCRWLLENKYDGKIESVPVRRMAYSEKHRQGIGTFTPSDPKSQDISELVGGIDLSTIGEVGVESDPRAYRFDGELNIANRGLVEFVEMLKCVSGDSLVFTPLGIRRIDSFATPDHPVGESRPVEIQLAADAGVETTAHLYHAGVSQTKRVTTRRGFVSEGTHEHRILVVDDVGVQVWRRHDELKIGDWVVLQRGQSLWGEDVRIAWAPRLANRMRVPERMSPELARWLGYLLAEGDTLPDGTVRFANVEEELRTDYAHLTQSLFGIQPRFYKKVVQFNSVGVLGLLHYLGWTTGAYNKAIPWSVLQSTRECVLDFLAGYFAGDGTVGIQGRLSWDTASERLSEQLQILLLNIGIISRRFQTLQRSTREAELKPYWKVLVTGEDADRLAAQMHLLPMSKRLKYDEQSAMQPRVGRTQVLPNTAHYWQAISDEVQRVALTRAQAVGATGY